MEDGEDAMSAAPEVDVEEVKEKKPKHKGKHDKPKPWDTDDIQHWKLEKFDPSYNEVACLRRARSPPCFRRTEVRLPHCLFSLLCTIVRMLSFKLTSRVLLSRKTSILKTRVM